MCEVGGAHPSSSRQGSSHGLEELLVPSRAQESTGQATRKGSACLNFKDLLQSHEKGQSLSGKRRRPALPLKQSHLCPCPPEVERCCLKVKDPTAVGRALRGRCWAPGSARQAITLHHHYE